MFTVEALQPLYHEERIKAATESRQASRASTAATSTATSKTTTPTQQWSKSQGPCPQTLAAALNRQQNATRSTGFLGSTFRTLSGTATPSMCRGTTPTKEKSQAELEAFIAEKKRDADIVSLPYISLYPATETNLETQCSMPSW